MGNNLKLSERISPEASELATRLITNQETLDLHQLINDEQVAPFIVGQVRDILQYVLEGGASLDTVNSIVHNELEACLAGLHKFGILHEFISYKESEILDRIEGNATAEKLLKINRMASPELVLFDKMKNVEFQYIEALNNHKVLEGQQDICPGTHSRFKERIKGPLGVAVADGARFSAIPFGDDLEKSLKTRIDLYRAINNGEDTSGMTAQIYIAMLMRRFAGENPIPLDLCWDDNIFTLLDGDPLPKIDNYITAVSWDRHTGREGEKYNRLYIGKNVLSVSNSRARIRSVVEF